ncbi:MAG: restriction endonuclease subunit S [Flavobacterium sp.]|nr:restriction endonuclease subunit S [Flavobacterium sp.]
MNKMDNQNKIGNVSTVETRHALSLRIPTQQPLKPYEKYKPSLIDGLGEIPAHWERWKLNRILFFQEGPGLRTWQFKDTGVKVICVTNITPPKISFAKMTKYISIEEYDEKYKHFTVEKGNILLASSGATWGKVATYNDDEKVILNTSTIRLNTKKNELLSNTIVKHLLNANYVNTQLQNLLTGSCQPNFGPTHLNKLYVALPTLEEQTAIANFLDYKTAKIDRFIYKKKQLIKLLNEQKAGIIDDAVTKGLNPNTKTKPSGIEWLGDIPQHWEIVKLRYLTRITTGNKNTEDKVENGQYDFFVRSQKIAKINSYSFDGEGILTAGDGVGVGKVFHYINGKCDYHQRVYLFYKFSNTVYAKYLFYFLQKFLKNELMIYNAKSTVDSVRLPVLKDFLVSLPPLTEQTAIVSHIETETDIINKTIATIEKEIALVQEYRTALIAEAVTGKIDVRNYELGMISDELEESENIDLEDDTEFDNQEIE